MKLKITLLWVALLVQNIVLAQLETISTEWSGSGFALNKGYVVTNYHVVEGAQTIRIVGVNGEMYKAYKAIVVAVDRNNDIALLKISDKNFKGFNSIPYGVKTQLAEVGESVFLLGYPLTETMGDEIKLTTGVISSRSGFQGDKSIYQTTAPIQPGNSGGPLFDNNGNVIGIVCAKHKGAENVGYAIKSVYLKNLIETSLDIPIVPTSNALSNQSLPNKVKLAKKFVFFIYCSDEYDEEYEVPKRSDNKHIPNDNEKTEPEIYESKEFTIFNRNENHNKSIIIKKLRTNEDYTEIDVEIHNYSFKDTIISVPENLYIDDGKMGYALDDAKGIQISPHAQKLPAQQYIKATLYFSPIPAGARKISLQGGNKDWYFWGVTFIE